MMPFGHAKRGTILCECHLNLSVPVELFLAQTLTHAQGVSLTQLLSSIHTFTAIVLLLLP